jgi:hypothetical protein
MNTTKLITEVITIVGKEDMVWVAAATLPSPHNKAVPEKATKHNGHLGRIANNIPDQIPVPGIRLASFTWHGAQFVRLLEAGIFSVLFFLAPPVLQVINLLNYISALSTQSGNRCKS